MRGRRDERRWRIRRVVRAGRGGEGKRRGKGGRGREDEARVLILRSRVVRLLWREGRGEVEVRSKGHLEFRRGRGQEVAAEGVRAGFSSTVGGGREGE
jgi:hypothetical protein